MLLSSTMHLVARNAMREMLEFRQPYDQRQLDQSLQSSTSIKGRNDLLEIDQRHEFDTRQSTARNVRAATPYSTMEVDTKGSVEQ